MVARTSKVSVPAIVIRPGWRCAFPSVAALCTAHSALLALQSPQVGKGARSLPCSHVVLHNCA